MTQRKKEENMANNQNTGGSPNTDQPTNSSPKTKKSSNGKDRWKKWKKSMNNVGDEIKSAWPFFLIISIPLILFIASKITPHTPAWIKNIKWSTVLIVTGVILAIAIITAIVRGIYLKKGKESSGPKSGKTNENWSLPWAALIVAGCLALVVIRTFWTKRPASADTTIAYTPRAVPSQTCVNVTSTPIKTSVDEGTHMFEKGEVLSFTRGEQSISIYPTEPGVYCFKFVSDDKTVCWTRQITVDENGNIDRKTVSGSIEAFPGGYTMTALQTCTAKVKKVI